MKISETGSWECISTWTSGDSAARLRWGISKYYCNGSLLTGLCFGVGWDYSVIKYWKISYSVFESGLFLNQVIAGVGSKYTQCIHSVCRILELEKFELSGHPALYAWNFGCYFVTSSLCLYSCILVGSVLKPKINDY